VVILFDPMQTAHGHLVLKCYKLTNADITWKKNVKNDNKNDTAPVSVVTQQEKTWASSDAQRRMESLLMAHQIRMYCDQVDCFAISSFGKIFLMGGLNKE
jgi:translation initiation factor 3 subunit H